LFVPDGAACQNFTDLRQNPFLRGCVRFTILEELTPFVGEQNHVTTTGCGSKIFSEKFGPSFASFEFQELGTKKPSFALLEFRMSPVRKAYLPGWKSKMLSQVKR
jgi:hypothetical protein